MDTRTVIGQRASVDQRRYALSVCPGLLIHVVSTLVLYTVHCNTRSTTSRWVRYSDKLPLKITCNCWNSSLWTTYQPNQCKQMSLEFPGMISLQIQVATKDFKSWIHYWTVHLSNSCPTVLGSILGLTFFHCMKPITPFTKTSPNYPHKNNADNSIKIAFTNSEVPKIIPHFIYEHPLKNTLKRQMSMWGRGDLWPRLGNCPHYLVLRSQFQSLVPMRLLCG